MTFSTFMANAILDQYLKNGTPKVSLHTADPGLAGANEVAGGGYARQAGTFGTAVAKATDNTNILAFTNMPAVTVTHVGIWDQVSSGNFLIGGPLTTPKTLNAGDTFEINVGDCDAVLT
jgi:hypothetical protein